jgi:hypothetical protein
VALPVGVPPVGDVTVAVKVTFTPEFDGFREEIKVVVVWPTIWFTTFDVLPPKFESPAYTAVIELEPTGSVEVVKVAEPPLNAPVPIDVVPFINVTVSPLGGMPELEVTVAVNVTACPNADGFCEDERVVVVVSDDVRTINKSPRQLLGAVDTVSHVTPPSEIRLPSVWPAVLQVEFDIVPVEFPVTVIA